MRRKIHQPSIPSSHCNLLYRPICFNRGSLGQPFIYSSNQKFHQQNCEFSLPPIGHLKRCSLTSWKPALINPCLDSSTVRRLFPNASPAARETSPHLWKALPGKTVPSSDFGTTLISACSNHPPGFTCLLRKLLFSKCFDRVMELLMLTYRLGHKMQPNL